MIDLQREHTADAIASRLAAARHHSYLGDFMLDVAGLVPLAPVLILPDRRASESFAISAVLTGATFFAIGVVRGRVLDQRPLAARLETLLIGGSDAGVVFLDGKLLERFAAHSSSRAYQRGLSA